MPETLDHIVQKCDATHGLCIKRHDAITNYVARALDKNGYTVVKEKTYTTQNGKLKPDLTAYSPDKVLVIDTQVIIGQFSLKVGNQNKIDKYKPLKERLDLLRSNGIHFRSVALNSKGALSADSAKLLSGFHILSKRNFKILTVQTLSWAGRIWRAFQDMTLTKLTNCKYDLLPP